MMSPLCGFEPARDTSNLARKKRTLLVPTLGVGTRKKTRDHRRGRRDNCLLNAHSTSYCGFRTTGSSGHTPEGEKAMRKIPFILTALGLLLCSLTLHGHAADSKKEVEALMKKKLAAAQKVLAGIALADFDAIAKQGNELLQISKKAEWKVLDTPLYTMYSNQFQNNVEEMIKNAKKKNVDATALSYVEVTLTCVKCHKHVREKRMVRLER
jgi:hypothetical protein